MTRGKWLVAAVIVAVVVAGLGALAWVLLRTPAGQQAMKWLQSEGGMTVGLGVLLVVLMLSAAASIFYGFFAERDRPRRGGKSSKTARQ